MQPGVEDKSSQRRVSEYVRYIGKYGIPIFLSFSVVDYIYFPSLCIRWFIYRLLVVSLCLLLLLFTRFTKNYKFLNLCFVLVFVVISNSMNLMMYESGGYQSAYIHGVILIVSFLVVIFRMSILQNTIISTMSYIPTIFIIFQSVNKDTLHLAFTLASFPIGMFAFTLVFSLSDNTFFEAALKEKLKSKRQEVLTRSFPSQLRHLVQEGRLTIDKNTVLEDCLVGFIDIVASTRMGNRLSLEDDWRFKEDFLNCVVKRSETFNMFILNQLGDGILFISDPKMSFSWDKNLIDFFRHVTFDFETVLDKYKQNLIGIDTGIKCGATLGQVAMGFIGQKQSFYTVMGPTVNLASRFASQAHVNQLAVSENVNQRLYTTHDVELDFISNVTMKGFEEKYNLINLMPASFYDMVTECASCNQMMSLMEHQGQVQIVCTRCDSRDGFKHIEKQAA